MPKRQARVATDSDENGSSEPSFEVALKELETIVAQMEAGDLALEVAIELHARGQKLATLCNEHLAQADLRVQQLSPDAV